jgi:hypothetical protein
MRDLRHIMCSTTRSIIASAVVAIVTAAMVTAAYTAWAEGPESREHDVRVTVQRVALDVVQEDPSTPNHTERVALANLVLRGDSRQPLHIASVAEAWAWDTGITWETVERAQLRTAISAVWDAVALAKYGQE